MNTVSRWTGLEATVLRTALRVTISDFAEDLGVHSRTVDTWAEQLAERTPRPEMQAALDTALARASEDVRARFFRMLSDGTPAPKPQESKSSFPNGDVMDHDVAEGIVEFTGSDMATRREFLELSLLTGTSLMTPVRQWAATVPLVALPPGRVGTDEITDLERVVVVFRGWDASGNGRLHRKAIVGQLNAAAEALREDPSPAVKPRLLQVAAELGHLAGWMSYDAGLHSVAQRYYLLGLQACKQVGAFDLGAKIVGDMSKLSKSLHRHDDSLAMLRAALAALPRGANPLVHAELLGEQACVYGKFGGAEASDARRSAEASFEQFDQATSAARTNWNEYMERDTLEGFAASAYTQLALDDAEPKRSTVYAQQAERHTLGAIQHRPELKVRSRLLDDIRLSKVRVAQQEPVEAVAVAQDALRRGQSVRSSLVVRQFVNLCGVLTSRYGDVPAVEEFRSELTGYVRHAEPGKEREIRA
jgi:hypothetical protein